MILNLILALNTNNIETNFTKLVLMNKCILRVPKYLSFIMLMLSFKYLKHIKPGFMGNRSMASPLYNVIMYMYNYVTNASIICYNDLNDFKVLYLK